MNFFQIWFLGIVNPSLAFDELREKPAPHWGFWAVLIRFIGTSMTTILALFLLDRQPFERSYLTFLSEENYYAAEIFFLPIFGIAIWILSSGIVHLVLCLGGKNSNFDQILNVVGMGMLIVMPVVWFWDWTMIGLNRYRMNLMAISHSVFAIWGMILHTIGFKKVLGVRTRLAIMLALIIPCVYIPVAMIFVR